MWLAIIWKIWKHHNGVIFKQGNVDPKKNILLGTSECLDMDETQTIKC